MFRIQIVVLTSIFAGLACAARADVVTDWNKTIYDLIQSDGMKPDQKANPGWSTRSIAMANGAIYDVFQAVDRKYRPFRANLHAPDNTSLEAAVNQAAYELLLHCYPNEMPLLQTAYDSRMHPSVIPNGEAKTNGIALGHAIAEHYKTWRTGDHASEMVPYTPINEIGKWQPDPYWPGLLNDPPEPQQAWGPGWRNVKTFAIPHDQLPSLITSMGPIPDLSSDDYRMAYDQVKEFGALDSTMRNDDQERIALFWAYDRPGIGPPPRLFIRNLWEIAEVVGNTPEENARMFAMMSVAQADAAVAAWDAKFEYNFWRPVTAIHQGDNDSNAGTDGDPNWRPLGAPGPIPDDNNPATDADYLDDFTPPFPAWTSGHATMGGAVFKTLANFYRTNVFDEIDGIAGNDPMFFLNSDEVNSGGPRGFTHFFHEGTLGMDTYAGSPDGENGISRIFLGIHWIFDQQDGIDLGHSIADYVNQHYFYAVPEPDAIALTLVAVLGGSLTRRNRR